MRSSIKVSLIGLLIAGALACSADAMGAASGNSNGPDAFIGIVGGNPGASVGGIPYNRRIYPEGGYQANFGRIYHNDHGGNGAYDVRPDH
jgi:hypothetical protein